MRTATVFNFLLEANLMASAAILLMILFRKFLRRPLGNQLLYGLWLLIAVRLLFPLALANPYINEIRPFYLSDEAIRPIAGQIKVRISDIAEAIANGSRANGDSLFYQGASNIQNGLYRGTLPALLFKIYLWGAGAVLLIFGADNIRFRRRMKQNRIEPISGKLKERYLAICAQRKVKPIPVWLTDPLPSACLVGVIRPYIALPLTAAPENAVYILTHEICHYKGRDHWLGMVRLLCCAVHWFNPLVWIAAYMSRTDSELACDSRVVSKLPQEERKGYTHTLVTAASRRYAPGVGVLATGMTMTGRKLQSRVRSILNFEHAVKWLVVTAVLLAVMLLAASFFTAEGEINAAPYLQQISGYASIQAAHLVDQNRNTFTDMPAADGLTLQEALDVAMQTIHDEFGAEIDDLSRYSVSVDYYGSNTQNRYMDSVWMFSIIDSENRDGSYIVAVRASDGRIMDLSGLGHG